MKVLLVVHQFFPEHGTGTEVLTLELARGLQRRGHRVEILTGAFRAGEPSGAPSAAPPWLTESVYDGITVHRLNYDESDCPDPITLHSSAPARTELVRRIVSRTEPEIVHINHFLGLSSEIIPAIRKLGTPVVFTATDFWAVCPQVILRHRFDGKVCDGPAGGRDCIRCCVNWFRSAPIAWTAKALATTGFFRAHKTLRQVQSVIQRPRLVAAHVNASSMIISATQFLADMLTRNGIEARLMRIIPYGVDIGEVGRRPEVPRRFTVAAPLRLAFMGSIAELKGAHVLLDALAALGDRAGAISLHLYGKGNPAHSYVRALRAKVERLGGIAVLAGTFPHDQIGAVLTNHHLLVVPSLWYESAPLVLCAALAARIPALVSRLGGMTEVIKEGVDGLSFAAGDATALKKVLLGLLDDPEIVGRLHRTIVGRRRLTADYVADIEAAYIEAGQGR